MSLHHAELVQSWVSSPTRNTPVLPRTSILMSTTPLYLPPFPFLSTRSPSTITDLYMQQLWSVPPWLTHRHTNTDRDSLWLAILLAQLASWAKISKAHHTTEHRTRKIHCYNIIITVTTSTLYILTRQCLVLWSPDHRSEFLLACKHQTGPLKHARWTYSVTV